MSAAFQIGGLVAISAGAATVSFALLSVVFAVGVFVVGIGGTAYLIGAAIERDEEVPDEVSASRD